MPFTINRARFLPGQRAFWETKKFMPLLVGGYGSGKTYIGAMRIIRNSRLNAGIPNMYVSPTFPIAKDTIIQTLEDIFDRSTISYTHNKTDHKFHIKNWDGHIWIASGDKPDSLKGPNIGSAIIDEPFIQKKAVLDQVLARCRHPEASIHEIGLTGTPEELNWGYSLATEWANDYDVDVIQASTRDNKYLPPEYVGRLLSAYNKKQIDALVDGNFVNLTTGRAYEFTRTKNVKERPDLHGQGLPIIIGQDYNVAKMCTAIGYKLPNGIHWFDEIVIRDAEGSATEAVTKEINARMQGEYNVSVIPDGTGKARHPSAQFSDHQIMRNGGLKVIARTNPREKARINAVNKLWRDGNMTVDPKCKEIIIDSERSVWNANGEVDQRKDPERSHMTSALGYPAEYYFPIYKAVIGSTPRYKSIDKRRRFS